MKLYYYSNELLKFIEKKWVRTRFVLIGMFVGASIFFGAIGLETPVRDALGYRLTHPLTSENRFLHGQVSLITHQADTIEMQIKRLNDCADTLSMLLRSCKADKDTISSFVHASTGENLFITGVR